LMRLAECYYRMHKFTDARLKFTAMTTSYPDFEDIETAYYRIGQCYFEESLPPQYDQTETAQCIDAFRVFLDKFPNSKNYLNAIDYVRKAQQKLIEKKYYNGYIYYKMKDYSSALMYFTDIINLGNESDLERKSLYYAIKINLFQNNEEAAIELWDKMKIRYPSSKEEKKLSKYF
jgi:outer membrane protein assembly factor BamD